MTEISNFLRKEARKFWKGIIYKEGKLDEEQVLKELDDFYFVMQQVPRVYAHATNGLLSKLMYTAETVIAAIDDDINKNYVHKDDLRSLLE